MYYYSTVIAEYCTVMQDCDTVQSSCDNDLRGTLCSPAFRLKGSQFLQTALSHLYVLLVAPGNRTLNPMGSTLRADQHTRQIVFWWLLTFEGNRFSFQYKPWHNSGMMCTCVLSQRSVKATPNYHPKSREFSQAHSVIRESHFWIPLFCTSELPGTQKVNIWRLLITLKGKMWYL